jgi:hypothetical protein
MDADSRSEQNRRQHPRIACTPTAAIMKVEGSSKLLTVLVSNVSGMGMGLRLAAPIELGSKIRITFPQTVVTGEICFCRLNEDQSYEAGLLITDVTAVAAVLSRDEEIMLAKARDEVPS